MHRMHARAFMTPEGLTAGEYLAERLKDGQPPAERVVGGWETWLDEPEPDGLLLDSRTAVACA
eukprot:9902101-Lingulodinium_polyedra.AAC.1